MRIINTSVCAFQNKVLVIGFEGENERTQVRIDASEVFTEYPNAAPSLTVKPNSGEAYPVLVNRDGTDVVWDITSSYLTERGESEIQLTFIKDSVVCKSYIGKALVLRSLTVEGEMPKPVESWVDAANAKLAEVDAQITELEGMVDTATDAAERAAESAEIATEESVHAEGSAETATAKANEATQAAGTATAKAAEAQTAAQTATAKATAAAESERIATAKAGEATTAAGTATTKAEQAIEAAETATEKAGDASASARAAHASEINAAESADDALAAKTAAEASETAAGASATQAAQSAQTASTAAQTATQKAAEATQSATDAETFAGTATTKAEEAAQSAQAASDAKTAVEQTAEQLAESLEQIDQNTQDIAELDERKANIDGYYPDMTVGNAEQLNSSKFVENSEPYTLRTSGGSSDIGNREYLDAVVGGTLAWNQAVRDEASENSTDFAPIVTVTDAVEDAAGVKVKIEPVQDLHGYDHPWPAGGGKNLLSIDPSIGDRQINGLTVKVNRNASGDVTSVVVNGTATLRSYITLGIYYLKSGTILNGCPSGGAANTYSLAVDSTSIADRGNGYEITEDVPQGNLMIVIANGFVCNNLTFYPMVRLASETDATFAPYSNICPITGWDGVQVWDDPKHGGLIEWNQILPNGDFSEPLTFTWSGTFGSVSVEDGVCVYTVSTVKSDNMNRIGTVRYTINITAGHKYYYRIECKTPYSQVISITGYSNSAKKTTYGMWFHTSAANQWFVADGIGEAVETGASDCRIGIHSCAQTSVGDKTYIRSICFFDLTQMFGAGNEPSTAEEFKTLFPAGFYPYNAGEITTVSAVNGDPYRHYSITLPTEAGTVYGGELTVNADGSGSLVVDRKVIVFDGSDNYTWTYAPNYYCMICVNQVSDMEYDVKISDYQNSYGIVVHRTAITLKQLQFGSSLSPIEGVASSVEEWKSKLNENPIQVVYPLATIQTYTLTASQIHTLLGTNNVWADTGDLALTYTGTDEHLTLESGKKYLARISGTDSMLLGSGQEITAAKGTDNVFDLTQMFGTAVADYVYGQGAAFFRKWFGGSHYPYNAGELLSVEGLQSHDMVGFNQWDEEWEVGIISWVGGNSSSTEPKIRSKGYIPVLPDTTYTITTTVNLQLFYYDSEKVFLSYAPSSLANKINFTTPANCCYVRFYTYNTYGTTYKHDICISLAHNGSRKGEYEPYEKHSYPLDSSVILRGIPKVGANGVYWDGDRYLPDGTVERRYGVVDLGTLEWSYNISSLGVFTTSSALTSLASKNLVCIKYPTRSGNTASGDITGTVGKWISANIGTGTTGSLPIGVLIVKDNDYTDVATFKAAMQGVLLVYELAIPTTETAQPYHSTQWVSDWGTEEFVSTGLVPVGTETRYPANLRDKLQHLPDAASGNGSYLITQTDGQMVLTPFPAPPSSAGNYVLKATVVNGVATYTWEVAT